MINRVEITDEILVLLDGKCDEKTQKEVDAAKLRLDTVRSMPEIDPKIAEFFAGMKRLALKSGRLVYQTKRSGYCPVCEKRGGYVKYKSGRKKGMSNFNRPITFTGVEFEHCFCSIKDRFNFGCCLDCFEKLKPLLPALADLRAEIPEAITGVAPKFKWHKEYKCKECGWIGGEYQMGRSKCLMGSGTYASTCPKCGAENKPLLDSKVELTYGYVLTEV